MAKEVFGEFTAYTTPGGIRFMKKGKLIKEPSVPQEVVNHLRQKLGDDSSKVVTPQPKFPRPSEEELARMKAESIAALAGKPGQEVKVLEETPEQPLNENDFDAPDSNGFQAVAEPIEPVPLPEQPEQNTMNDNYLESISIYTADLKDIAQALYDRFGIYTVYLGKLPQIDEINPLTANPFTKYHLGIAYQSFIFAQNQGLLERVPEEGRKTIDAGRQASANFRVDPVPTTMSENRQANSFAFRTSVRGTQTQSATRIEHIVEPDGSVRAVQVPIIHENGEENPNGINTRFDAEQDELIVEQPIAGARPIIRPNW